MTKADKKRKAIADLQAGELTRAEFDKRVGRVPHRDPLMEELFSTHLDTLAEPRLAIPRLQLIIHQAQEAGNSQVLQAAQLMLGVIVATFGAPEGLLSFLQEVAEKDPSPVNMLGLAHACESMGQIPEARRLLRRVARRGNDAERRMAKLFMERIGPTATRK